MEHRIVPANETFTVNQATVLQIDTDADGVVDSGETVTTTVTISNNSTNMDATGVQFTETLNGMTLVNQTGEDINVSPIAFDDGYSAVANTLLKVGVPAGPDPELIVSGNVFANDVEFFSDTFTLTTFDATSFNGGTVSLNADGSFTYLPAVGFTGTDTFTYTITDDGLDNASGTAGDNLTSVGTVTINIGTERVWYVDDSYDGSHGPSDGRSNRPFLSLAPLNAAATDPDAAFDTIFVKKGTGADYSGGITLEPNQILKGQGHVLIVGGFTVFAAGSAPTISNPGGTAVALSTNNQLRGFIAGSAGTSVSGASFGTLDVTNVRIDNSTGGGLSLSTGSFASGAGFNEIISASGVNGIALNSVNATGTIDLGSGALSGASGAEFLISGGNVALTYSGNISSNTGGSIDIGSHGTGNVTLSGAVNITGGTGISVHNNTSGTIAFTNASKVVSTGTGNAVVLDTNTGATINFTGGGLDIDTTTGTGFEATGGGTVSVAGSGNSITTTTGTALNLNGVTVGAGGVTFATVSTNGAANGILLETVGQAGGSTGIDILGGSIVNASTRGVDINATQADVSIASTISTTAAGRSVEVTNSGRNVAGGSQIVFSAAIDDNGLGINLDNNDQNTNGAVITFSGGLDIDSTTSTGFNAVNGGTINVTGTNTIDTTSGNGLIIANTTIGASNLTFQRISAGTGAGSAGVGISLDNTGSTGRLIVTGTGGAGSGGTIQHKTGADQSRTSGIGIYLNNTLNPSFDRMQLNDFDNFAIRGNNVAGFSLTNSVVNGVNGNNHVNVTGDSYGEGAIYFGNNGGASADTDAGSGTFTFTNNSITGGRARNLSVVDAGTSGGDLRLNVSNVIFGLVQNHQNANTTLALETRGVGTTAHSTVTGTSFAGQPGDAMNFTGQQSSTMHVMVGGAGALANTIVNNHAFNNIGGGSMNFSTAGTMFADVRNNTMSGADGSAVTLFKAGSNDGSTPRLDVNFDGNTIGTSGVAGSGSKGSGNGIFVSAGGTGSMTLAITNNMIQQYTGNCGIFADNTGGSYTVNMTVTGNTTRQPGGGAFGGIAISNGSPTSTDTVNVFAKINGNDFSDGAGAGGIDILLASSGAAAGHLFTLTGTTNSTFATDAAVESFILANNLNPGATSVDAYNDAPAPITNFRQSTASPLLPTAPTPLLAAPGGIESTPPAATTLQDECTAPVANIPSPDFAGGSEMIVQSPAAPVITSIANPVIVDDGMLTQAELDYYVEAAITRWNTTGLTAKQLAFIRSVTFEVADMPGMYLGSFAPGLITLDSDAAGHGWFLDATPFDDSEFGNVLSATRMQTDPTLAPAGHYDVLTTVMHEMGHALGLEDSYAAADREGLMYGWLFFGERRLPGQGEADGAIAGSIDSEEFLGGPITIGTLPFGKTVTIQWQATIDVQNNQLIVNPVNQGTVSATNAPTAFPDTNTNTVTTTVDTLILGGTIWNDNGAGGGIAGNGIKDGTEPGVSGVTMSLFVDADNNDVADTPGTPLVTGVLTNGSGDYSFTGLAPGNYIVRVDQDNFDAGGNTSLTGLLISPLTSPEQPDPDNNTENDDNGARIDGNPAFTKSITLAYNTEPTAGTGNDTNNTVDIGFMNNPPPVLNNLANDTSTFTEDGVAVLLDQTPAATVTDDQTHFNGGNLTASILLNEVASEDVLGISTAGTVSIAGTTVSVGGVAIGTITSDGTGGNDLVVTFNTTDATPARVSTLIQALTYFNSNTGNPSTLQRNITVGVNDGLTGVDVEAVFVNITAVNDGPTINAPASIGVTEDVASPLTGIIFADVDAAAGSVTATLSVASGTLAATSGGGVTVGGTSSAMTLAGTVANINTFIAGGNVTFTTVLNSTSNVTLTIDINDNGNTGSGPAGSASTNVTLTVTAVNDAPTILAPGSIGVTEDVASLLTGISVADVDGSSVTVTFSVPSGTLSATSGGGVTVGGSGSASLTLDGTISDVNSFIAASNVFFTTALNATANVTLNVAVNDNGNTGTGGAQSANTNVTLTVTAVNDAPEGTDNTVGTLEDTPYTLTAADFGFSDPVDSPANALLAVQISTLPALGALTNNGNPVSAGAFVPVTDINGGLLRYTPANNGNGSPYSSFTFQVQDDGGTVNGGVDLDSTPNTLSVNVLSVNDAPAGTDNTVTTLTDTDYVFTAADFGFTDNNDSPPNNFIAVSITTLPALGTLTDLGVPVTSSQFFTVAEINVGQLHFVPVAGTGGSPYTTFTFQVQDNGGTLNGGANTDPTPNTITINVSDTVPPDTTITVAPPAIDNDNTPTFEFTGTDNVVPAVLTFEYRVDGGAWIPAISPQTLNALSDGTHTFEVRAIDASGNADPTPDSHTWIVDTQPPQVTIGAPSSNYAKNSATVNYIITYTDANLTGITLTAADVQLIATNGASADVGVFTVSPTQMEVRLTNFTGNGTVGISIGANTANDAGGNQAGPSGPSATIIVDNIKPLVTLGSPSVSGTLAGPVSWVATITELNLDPAFMLAAADVTVLGTPPTITGTVTVTKLTAKTFRITLNNIFGGQGFVQIMVNAGAVVDLAQNASDASALSVRASVTGRRVLIASHVIPPLRMLPGQPYTFTIIGRNGGTQMAPNAALIVTLPAHATFVPGKSTPGWTDIGGGRFRLDVGDLARGARVVTKFAVVFDTDIVRGTKVSFSSWITDSLANGQLLSRRTSNIVFGAGRWIG